MKKIAYLGNDWIGMFVKTNNKHSIVPVDCTKKFKDSIEENLKTECIETTIGETNLAGTYLAMNSNGIILPNIATKKEKEKLKELGINIHINKDNHNANGNNIVVNDKGGLINPRLSKKEKKDIEDALGVELIDKTLSDYYTVGSSMLLNNKGALLNFRATQEDVQEIEEILKVKVLKGSTNLGTPFVSIGAVANDNGYVVGRLTTAYEMGRIEESLGFLD